ncbi:DUF6603 domain-containing protein [Mesorhizobium sp. CAU 1741]|uniref:DUF6603 domain-containing protein n=1 Tax=Mesorhizobium sp. CAU 1741 TaxID=3140366 RepID=UPI00325C21D0
MKSLVESVVSFIADNLVGGADVPPPPGKLSDIPEIIRQLSSVHLEPGNNGPADWLLVLTQHLGDIELRDTVIIRAIQVKAPRLAEALVASGLIKVNYQPGDQSSAYSFTFVWDRLDSYLESPGEAILTSLLTRVQDIDDFKVAQILFAELLASPAQLLRMEYTDQGFDALPDPSSDGVVDLDEVIAELINSPLRIALPFGASLDYAQLLERVSWARQHPDSDTIALLGPEAPYADRLEGFGLELKLNKVEEFAARTLDLGGGWTMSGATTGTGAKTFRLVMSGRKLDSSQGNDTSFDVKLDWRPSAGRAIVGPPNGTRVEAGPMGITFRFEAAGPPPAPTPLFSIRARVEQVAFVLAKSDLGLLGDVLPLPDEIRLQGDLSVFYRQNEGLQMEAGGDGTFGVELPLPLDLNLGSAGSGLGIDHVLARLDLRPTTTGLEARIGVRAGASGRFGPLTIAADGIGGWFGRWDSAPFGGYAPTQVAVFLEAGPVSGGGMLATLADQQFAGGLALNVIGIGVGAFALFGKADDAAAFVGVLGVRLPMPGVQIGFGFAVTGVGGVVGINRRADTDVLREQIVSGTSADILFCDDPARSGLSVVRQLPRLFPAARGVFLIGPTFRISWLELFKLDAGLFIELPGPRQIFVAGSARLVIGSEHAALVYLRVDFVGGVDLVKSLIYFDAALVNSQVLQVFKVTGGVALRIAYGDNGYFLFSVGGFHPSFNPGGLELPALARAGTSTSVSLAWLKLETYFALTSNTFQIGAGVEAGVRLGPIAAHGWFRFDAMAQYDPFRFTARVDAGFDVEVKGVSLCGVRVTGNLSGPGPLVLNARASVKVLFVRITKDVTIRFGSAGGDLLRAPLDLVALMAPEFVNPANIRAEGEDVSVALRPQAPVQVGGRAVVGVTGPVIWEQKRAPLGHDLQRFEGAPLARGINGQAHRLNLVAADTTVEDDWFGSGSFMDVSDAQALNNTRFVQLQSGVRLGSGRHTTIDDVTYDVTIDIVKLPKRRFLGSRMFTGSYVSPALAGAAAERSGGARVTSGGPRVRAVAEKWNAFANDGSQVATALPSTQAFMTARERGGTAQPAMAVTVSLQGVL